MSCLHGNAFLFGIWLEHICKKYFLCHWTKKVNGTNMPPQWDVSKIHNICFGWELRYVLTYNKMRLNFGIKNEW